MNARAANWCPRSLFKADQEGHAPRSSSVGLGGLPIKALAAWLETASIHDGPIFGQPQRMDTSSMWPDHAIRCCYDQKVPPNG
jgi:hypothetical protein